MAANGNSRRQLKIITTGALCAGGGHDLKRHHHFCFGSSVGSLLMAQPGCSKLHDCAHRRQRSPPEFMNCMHLTRSKSCGDKGRLFHGTLLSLFLRTSLSSSPPLLSSLLYSSSPHSRLPPLPLPSLLLPPPPLSSVVLGTDRRRASCMLSLWATTLLLSVANILEKSPWNKH